MQHSDCCSIFKGPRLTIRLLLTLYCIAVMSINTNKNEFNMVPEVNKFANYKLNTTLNSNTNNRTPSNSASNNN